MRNSCGPLIRYVRIFENKSHGSVNEGELERSRSVSWQTFYIIDELNTLLDK